MAAGDLALLISITAKDNASSVFAALGQAAAKLAGGDAMGAVAVAGVAAAAGIVALGVASVKSAGDFQAGMTSLVTGAGESKDALAAVGAGVMQISTDTGASTKDLTAGLYLIESAGYHGADGLKILTTAAQGAAVGNADLTQVASVLTTTMHDYNIPIAQSVPVMNSLIATTAQGKMKMDDLTGALTKVLPTASKAGVSFTDVEGALATMSLAGDKGAAAGTHLNQMLLSLEKPSAAASAELKTVGLTTDQVSAEMKVSLPGAIEMITDAIGKKFPVGSAAYIAALGTIVGGTKQMQAVLELSGTSMSDLQKNTAAVTAAYKDSGKEVTGYSLVQQDLNFQLGRLSAAFNVLLITIGEKLLPVITPLVKGFANFLATLGNVISGVTSGNKAFGLLGAAIALVIVAAAAIASPFVAGAVAIAAMVAALKLMYDKVQPVHDAIDALGKIVQQVAGYIGGLFTSACNAVSSAISKATTTVAPLIDAFSKSKEATNLLIAALIGLSVAITASLMPAIIAFVTTTIPALLAGLATWLASLIAIIAATLVAAAPYIALGIVVAAVIFAILEVITHWGEITKWLKQQWDDFSAAYTTTMKNIQKIDESVRKSIEDGWDATMKHLTDDNSKNVAQEDKDWSNISKTVTGWAQTASKNVVTAFDKMSTEGDTSAKQIGASLQWLYDHNIYIKQLCDAMTGYFQTFIKWAQTAWGAFSKWWDTTLAGIGKSANTNYTAMMKNIQQIDESIRKNVQDDWDGISKYLSDNWNKNNQNEDQSFSDMAKSVQKWGDSMDKSIEDCWNKAIATVKQWGTDATTAISNALSAMGKAISGFWQNTVQPALGAFGQQWNQFWSNLVASCAQIGENLMKEIASGIKQGAGAIGTAIHDAIAQALSSMGFVNIPGFASGVQNFAGGWAIVGEAGPELLFLPSGSSVMPSTGSQGGMPSMDSGTSGLGTSGDQPQNIYVMLNGTQIGKAVSSYQQKELHVQAGMRGI